MGREYKYVASFFLSVALVAPVHKDYHNWDAREDQAYHRSLETKHQAYVDYGRLEHKRQEESWKWRHNHEEHEEYERH